MKNQQIIMLDERTDTQNVRLSKKYFKNQPIFKLDGRTNRQGNYKSPTNTLMTVNRGQTGQACTHLKKFLMTLPGLILMIWGAWPVDGV